MNFIMKKIWMYRYRRFVQKWRDVISPHLQYEYFNDIDKLAAVIPKGDYVILYRATTNIQTAYLHIEEWLREVTVLLAKIQKNRVTSIPNLNFVEVSLSAWLRTKDDAIVQYQDGLNVVHDALTDLYQSLFEDSEMQEMDREYTLKQYKELFISGINFYLTLLHEYALH